MLMTSSCGSGDEEAASTKPNKNRYLWWTSEAMSGDNGFYYTANVVKGSLIYQSPYLSSNDGVTWSTSPSDNLHRSFESFGGYFIAEVKNSVPGTLISDTRVYTPLNGGSSITVNKASGTTGISRLAWEGGSTVYAIANNSGGIYGGDSFKDYVLKSTNSGQTWTPLTTQPSEHSGRLSFDGLWLIDGNLFVMEFINTPSGTRRKIHLATDAGESGFWIESSELTLPLSFQGVSFSSLLVDHYDRLGKDEILMMSGQLKSSIDNTIKMADNLITWARINMNDVQYRPEVIKVKDIASNICDVYKDVANNKGLIVSCIVSESLKISGDKSQIEFVVRNLVNNAIKFTHSGGAVSLTAESLQNGEVELKVSDTGVGLSPEMKQKLFTVGNKQSVKGTAGENGTGLGLILSYEFVKINGGRIDVESELGKGTSFLVRFKEA